MFCNADFSGEILFLVNGMYYKPESNITLTSSTDIYCVSDANPSVQCSIPMPDCGGNNGGENGGFIDCFMNVQKTLNEICSLSCTVKNIIDGTEMKYGPAVLSYLFL